jgi:hypothetical protein
MGKSSTFVENLHTIKIVNNYEHIRTMADSICTGTKRIVRLVDSNGTAEKGRIQGGRQNVEASCVCAGSHSPVQEKTLLTAWAKQTGCYIPCSTIRQWQKMDSGTEAVIYLEPDNQETSFIRKVVSHHQMSFSGYPSEFLDRISIFNAVFPTTAYRLLGINCMLWRLKFVVMQPFIQGKEIGKIRDATRRNEIMLMFAGYMESLGFVYQGNCTYYNQDYIVSDLHERNILMDDNFNFFVIDANVKLNDEARFNGQAKYADFAIIS